MPCFGPSRTSAGFDPKKVGEPTTNAPFDDREVQRHVVAFDAPSPRPTRRRRAEDREEIPLGIANERRAARRLARRGALRRLERVQDTFSSSMICVAVM